MQAHTLGMTTKPASFLRINYATKVEAESRRKLVEDLMRQTVRGSASNLKMLKGRT
jgi:hypothetical protein